MKNNCRCDKILMEEAGGILVEENVKIQDGIKNDLPFINKVGTLRLLFKKYSGNNLAKTIYSMRKNGRRPCTQLQVFIYAF